MPTGCLRSPFFSPDATIILFGLTPPNNSADYNICGDIGPLSLEHVPPKKAFNDKRVIKASYSEYLRLGPEAQINGRIQQGGVGFYTLCERCNNNTGAWYGSNFINWCYLSMDILIKSRGCLSLYYLNYVFPLQVIKQIITMFFSVNNENFGTIDTELTRFVLNKEMKYLSPKYRFFIYYSLSNDLRYFTPSGMYNLVSGKTFLFSEIKFPPFGYVMTIDSDPPDSRLEEITHFSRFNYSEFQIFSLRIPTLETNLQFPGDYRSKKEIQEDYEKTNINNIPS